MSKHRMSALEYKTLLETIDKDYFKKFFLSNCNDNVCTEFGIHLCTMYKLIKDLNMDITEEQKRQRNAIATSQKYKEKTGYTCAFENPEVINKIASSVQEKYGVTNVFASEQVKKKIRSTINEKYGVDFPQQSEEIRKKSEETFMKHYGETCYLKTDECKDRVQKTCLEKYGVAQVSCFGTEKYNDTIRKKYGVEYCSQSEVIKERIKKSNRNKYGVDWFSQTPEHQKKLRARYSTNSVNFDSFPELAVYMYFSDNNIPICRPEISFVYECNGVNHYYFPDFNIDGSLVEIKGEQFFCENKMINPFDRSLDDEYEAKHQCMIKNGVCIWTSSEYQKYIDYFNSKYSKEDFRVNKQ